MRHVRSLKGCPTVEYSAKLLRDLYYFLHRIFLRVSWRCVEAWEVIQVPEGGPFPPPKLRFRVAESVSATAFRNVGLRTVELLQSALDGAGFELREGMAVLDFGCGCGRTLAYFSRAVPSVRWHGTDVDQEAIEWCRAHLPGVQFNTNGPLPPLPYPDQSFDLIYGVSVFTHLDQELQRAWIPELYRLLKPQGILMLSYYSRKVWASHKQAPRVAQEGFAFLTSTKLKGIVPDWYHTALQRQDKIVENLVAASFTVSYLENALGDQDLALARKQN